MTMDIMRNGMPTKHPTTFAAMIAAMTAGGLLAGLSVWGAAAYAAPPAHARQTHRIVAHAAHPRVSTPPDSYLQYKVYTVDQLIQQVSDNPVVRQRFARHFQLPADRVVDYMHANLVESYIPKTGRYTVYCVRHSGKFYPVRQTFHQGTKVFALRNGEPVMKWVCGNPLTKFASTVTDVVSNKPVLRPMVAEFIPSDVENQVVPTEKPDVKVSPSIQSLVSPVSSAVSSRGAGLAYAFLPALGLLGLNTGHHTTSTSHVVIPAVPEANGLLLLAVGSPFALIAVRRRKRMVKTDA